MPRRLKNLEVSWISLVDKGANQKTVIYKGAERPGVQLKTIDIAKSDEEKGLVYGIVYSPDEIDAHGDTADAATIEKAAYDFMKNLNLQNVDENHNLIKQEAYVVESWIVRKGDELFTEVGSWAVAIKLESDELKKAVKDGEITGISLMGKAEVTEEKGFIQKIKDLFKGEFNTKLAEDEQYEAISRLTWILQRAINEVIQSDNIDKKDQINESIEEFKIAINGLSIMKAGAVLSSANVKKLQAALASIQTVLELANTKENKEARLNEEQIKKYVTEVVGNVVTQAVQKALHPEETPEGKIEKMQKALDEKDETIKKMDERLQALESKVTKSAGNDPDGSTTGTDMGVL